MVKKPDSVPQPPTPPRYLSAVLACAATAPKGRVCDVYVLHDDWCALLAGAGPCCCSPTVTRGFVLWHRPRKGAGWSMVARGPTEAAAAAMAKGNGEHVVLPAGTEP